MTALRTVLIDMGGVVLEMGSARGFPVARQDWRGREALLRRVRELGGRAGRDDLERLLFGPWRQGYERRNERGREEPWQPHLGRLKEAAGIEADDLDLLGAWFRPYGDQLRPTEGIVEALEALRRAGRRIALVSNVPMPGALYRRVLAAHRLEGPFDSFHFSYDSGSRKPSPAMLRAALERLEADPSSAVMVGDRRDRDVAAGRAAGVATIWLRREEGAPGPEPDLVVASPAELPAAILGDR